MKQILSCCFFVFTLIFTVCHVAHAVSSDQETVLKVHNRLRAKHDAPPLKWSYKLAHYAEKYGKQCRFAHTNGPYGENLARGYRSIDRAVMAWYEEINLYSYVLPRFTHKTGHFSQLVWKNSRYIGCANIHCNGKNGLRGDYLICEYDPPGNVVGFSYFAENVTRPQRTR